MTRDEAVEHANRWVLSRYPVIPPLAMVLDFAPDQILELEKTSGHLFPPEEVERCIGKWCVLYRCSWDTDERGLPLRLGVLVDDCTGKSQGLWQ